MKQRFVVFTFLCIIATLIFGCGQPSTSPPAGPSAPSTPPATKEMVIRYSSTTTEHLGEWYEYLDEWQDEADPGYIYLVVSLDIENKGYDSFSTNSFYFSVIVSNVEYHTTWLIALEDKLKLVDLLDGGSTSGKLAFEVPEEVTSTGYQLKYQAWETYNINWIKQ